MINLRVVSNVVFAFAVIVAAAMAMTVFAQAPTSPPPSRPPAMPPPPPPAAPPPGGAPTAPPPTAAQTPQTPPTAQAPAADPKDVATMDAIVAALYDVISGPA